jgi:leucyl/phenylalanyl-tRNA--protein transferase
LPIEELHVPRRVWDLIKAGRFRITVNQAFDDVISGCAAPGPRRPETWINPAIAQVFCMLHRQGHAHSIECWDGDTLAGGIYGLAIGHVFCGESMFSNVSGASKVALVHLAARLWRAGFQVFDTQFINDHLLQFGAYEISQDAYMKRLQAGLSARPDFMQVGEDQASILNAYRAMRRAEKL